MPVEEMFRRKNNELQQKVILEIEGVKDGQIKKNMLQLQSILKELQVSEYKKNMVLSWPGMIIDSWDFSDQLGIELMELVELYKKI